MLCRFSYKQIKCISNCEKCFFFQTVVGSIWSGLLLLWHIKLIFLTSMWVVIYPWLTNYCYNNYRLTWIQILACECFFSPFIFYSFRCLLLLFFISPCFYCLSCLLNLSNYKHQKNVGLVIIQRVVMRCSIEGRQKTVSNSLVSISEIKAKGASPNFGRSIFRLFGRHIGNFSTLLRSNR